MRYQNTLNDGLGDLLRLRLQPLVGPGDPPMSTGSRASSLDRVSFAYGPVYEINVSTFKRSTQAMPMRPARARPEVAGQAGLVTQAVVRSEGDAFSFTTYFARAMSPIYPSIRSRLPETLFPSH